jgi:hypothetical protein
VPAVRVRGDDERAIVALVADHARLPSEQRADRVGGRREDLGRLRLARDEFSDAAERCLLAGEP